MWRRSVLLYLSIWIAGFADWRPVNIVKGDIEGLDIGVVNVSAGMYGLQIGLLSIYTEKLEGIQIGLINCAMA
jgi:hypothetical protein